MMMTNARGSDLDPSTREDGLTAKWGVDATAKPSLAVYTPRHRIPPDVWQRLNLKDFGIKSQSWSRIPSRMSWSLPLAHEPFSDRRAIAPAAHGRDRLQEGVHVPAETSRRLACDASRVVMWHRADGQTPDVGCRTRTIPPALRRALLHRDRGCRFPGCGVPTGQGHHLRHWANGGPTTLHNLALLCRRHHRAVHEEGYQVDRTADGQLCFRRPDGRPLPAVPPSAMVPTDPVVALRVRHRAQGLTLHPRTACPTWCGEPLDLGWAIDVLHPLANPLRAQLPVVVPAGEEAMAPWPGS
jgi:HNH endonuclease